MASRAYRYGDGRPVAASMGSPSRRDVDWQDSQGALCSAWTAFEDLESGVWEYYLRIVDSGTGAVVSRTKAVGFARASSVAPLASHFGGIL